MKQPSRLLGCVLALMMLGASTPGCDTGIALDTTIGDLIGGIPLSSDATIGDLLSVLTSGDLAAAFDQFAVNARGNFAGGQFASGLATEQIAEIEALQAQLSAGDIEPGDFSAQVREVLGDRAPNLAFGGFGFGGSPFGFGADLGKGEQLDLSDEQQDMAREIFGQLHADIAELRSAAHDEIRAVLSEDQIARLQEMRARRPGGGFRGLPGSTARGFRPGGGSFSVEFAEQLGLSNEQQTTIEEIRDALRTAVMERHANARDAFIGMLTPEQVAQLEQIEAEREAIFGDGLGNDG